MDIELKNITKKYESNIVISNLTETFPSGKCTVIMGKSGCGKTTLLSMMMGIVKPDDGEIKNVPSRKAAVFQEDRLIESLSVRKNLEMVIKGKLDETKVREQLEAVGLEETVLDKKVAELSGGMKRRVAIVRAFIAESEIVFTDEPFEGLDIDTKELTMKYVKEKSLGKTFIMVTHEKAEADFFADKVICL